MICCTRSLTPFQYDYKLNDITLSTNEQHPYLGILLHKALSWSGHITNIANRASQIFNFLRRNLSKCSPTVKASSYLTLVRPIMEYAALVWDPYHHNDIQTLEKVQRRAAHWVMNDYSWYSSVSNMLNNLNWPSLHLRRRISRLQTFYKATYKLSALSIPSYFAPSQRLARHFHPLHYIIPSTRTTSHQQSYFPRSIKDWNELPNYIIESNNLQSFTTLLINHYNIA